MVKKKKKTMQEISNETANELESIAQQLVTDTHTAFQEGMRDIIHNIKDNISISVGAKKKKKAPKKKKVDPKTEVEVETKKPIREMMVVKPVKPDK